MSISTSASRPTTVDKSQSAGKKSSQNRANDVAGMVADLSKALEAAINEIHSVNSETKVLALNARIEAARAGNQGSAFSVVAEEMQELSEKTSQIADAMATRTRQKTADLMDLIGSTLRGTRLSDLALTNIDLMDRNLYERTCDVRWWATDSSLVDALTQNTPEAREFASQRMGVILGAYTVYYDLVLCDRDGLVVANANPREFGSKGMNESRSDWFSAAMSTQNGDQYGFQTAHLSPLVNSQPALIYSCAVRENGLSNGRPLGALGIVFNWNGLSRPILEEISVSSEELAVTRAYIIDSSGQILASNQGDAINKVLGIPKLQNVFESPKGFFTTEIDGKEFCVAHAKAPGFETYSTGWYSLIMQPVV